MHRTGLSLYRTLICDRTHKAILSCCCPSLCCKLSCTFYPRHMKRCDVLFVSAKQCPGFSDPCRSRIASFTFLRVLASSHLYCFLNSGLISKAHTCRQSLIEPPDKFIGSLECFQVFSILVKLFYGFYLLVIKIVKPAGFWHVSCAPVALKSIMCNNRKKLGTNGAPVKPILENLCSMAAAITARHA